MHETKHDKLEQVYTLHEVERKTLDEVAAIMKTSVYQVRQWRKDPDYATVQRDRRAERHDAAVTQVHEMGQLALDTLRALMLCAKSELVRYQAAAKMGDWLGLGQLAEVEATDERESAKAFLSELLKRATVQITLEPERPALPPVEPGGLLPQFEEGAWHPIATHDLTLDT